MKKLNKKVGKEIILEVKNTSYKPSKIQKLSWATSLVVNFILIFFFLCLVWAVFSMGGENIKNYAEQHCYPGSNSADVNCLLAI